MILRDESEVALNDLIGLCDTAAETYETAAKVVAEHDADLAALFRELGEQRRRMERELRAQDERIGDVPHGVDPDFTTLHDLFVRVKSAFAADERRTLIADCEAAENGLAARLGTALTLELPQQTAAILRQMHYEVTAALGRLAAAGARL
jgi:uncharacterized protein (TIGR02284 family)